MPEDGANAPVGAAGETTGEKMGAAGGTGLFSGSGVPSGTGGFLESVLGGNPYFTAGFGLMGLGAGLAVARSGLVRLSGLIYRQLICDLEIASKDKSYDWVLEWMAQNPSRHSRNFGVETKYVQHDNGAITSTFELVPGPGRHLVKYRGAYLLVKRERNGRLMDLRSGSPFETITLTTLYRDRWVFNEILQKAQASAQQRQEGKTVIYTSYGHEWRQFGQPRRKRSLDSVVLDTGVKERVVTDMRDFLSSGDWYADRGIPYRRGYLLYGPPGSGKTSLIQALAGELDYNICILNLSEHTLTDDRLNHLMNNVPARSILLLEDVDAAFSERKQATDQGYTAGVTFSGLLNALDGVASADERIIFLTTNHPDRLDPALIRPGRVDMQELLNNATADQIRRMFLRFYDDPGAADQFVQTCIDRNKPISTAQLQGLFVFHKNRPEAVIDVVKKI